VLILALLCLGMMVGGLAQVILGRHGGRVDWTLALFAGFGGSFVGGLLFSLLAGDGLAIKPSGIIGSLVGALAITAVWQWYAHKRQAEERAAELTRARSGRHH
jgi:uncharacterized membrane protein YeaQ/YmgE (transglycosylase-associated protein family)